MTSDQAKIIADTLLTTPDLATLSADQLQTLLESIDIDTPAPAFQLTDDQFKAIMPALPASKRQQYLPLLNEALVAFEITTPLRVAAFIAQIAYESVELKYFAEIWGPTAQQKKYEPSTEVSKSLGNTEKGDGARFKGRGALQITGRNNYAKYGPLIGQDLIANPELAEQPEYAFHTACAFWKENGLNDLADKKNFEEITKKINGGVATLAERQKYYTTALTEFA